MDRQIAFLTSVKPEATMTLKEITDILKVRHDNAMRTVSEMAQDNVFGHAPQIEERYNSGKNTLITYNLTKRQSIAVAAKLNTSLLMNIIDRWQILEDAEAERQQAALAKQQAALADEREARAKLQKEYTQLSFSISTGKSAVKADMFDWKLRFRALISAHTRKPDMYGFKHTPKDAVDALAPYADDALRLISVALNAKMALGTSMMKCGIDVDTAYRVLEEFATYVDREAEDTDEHNR